MVGSMNQSERAAYEHLQEKLGYKESDITRKNAKQNPDFICPDKAYEVKRLYGNTITVYKNQVEDIEEHKTEILVVDDSEVVESFLWENREGTSVNVNIHEQNQKSVPKRVSDEVEEHVSNNQKDDEDWMDALDRLLGLNKDGSNSEYLTKSEVEDLIEGKIEEARTTRF